MEDPGDYFSLKWNNFRSSLTEGFYDFLQEEAMVDVTLAAEGKFVQAHKLVLSVCSPYFKNLFKVNPCKHPIVFLNNVQLNDLSYMLEFMYKGEVGVRHEDLQAFLKLAEALRVRGLTGEKIQSNEDWISGDFDSSITSIKKKVSKDAVSDVNKENSEFISSNEKCQKKVLKKRSKRFNYKSKTVKKLKSEKCDDDKVNKCDEKNNDNVSEDEDNNPLIKFVSGDNVKSGGDPKQSVPQSDNESESQCDNKTTFGSGWSDDIPDSDDSGGPDINSFFQTRYSEDTEQTPQGHLSSLVISRAPRAFVWDYFLKETHQAICLNCGKTFKGQRPNTICEQHLRRRHPEFYKILLEKKIKRAELHMNPMIMRLGIPSYEHD